MPVRSATTRHIGGWGTAARLAAGGAALAGAAVQGISALDALLGLVVFPFGVIAALAVRGRHPAPLRFTGSAVCCLIGAGAVAGFIVVPVATLLFLGASLLVAGVRGDAGCELSAVSNLLRRRDDQVACPIFDPIDAAERRAARRSAPNTSVAP